jgi:hypothetical protein
LTYTKWSSSWGPDERDKEFRWSRESKLVSDAPDKEVVNSGGYQSQCPTSPRITKNLTENGSETDCRTLEEGDIMFGVHNPLCPEVQGMLQL